jgi:HEAT repeat protein
MFHAQARRVSLSLLVVLLTAFSLLQPTNLIAATPKNGKQNAQAALAELDGARLITEWSKASNDLKDLLTRSPEAKPVLRAYAANPGKDGRKRFIALSASLEGQTVGEKIGAIATALKGDRDFFFKSDCARALGKLGTPQAKELLRATLNDKSEHGMVRVAASEGLAEMGDDSGKDIAVESIVSGTQWADLGMRTLEKLKADDSISKLESALVSKDFRKRNDSRLAILRIKLASAADSEKPRLLEQALREGGFDDVRVWAARAAAQTENPGPFLSIIAKDTKAPGQREAIYELRQGVKNGRWSEDDLRRWSSK